jgi:hypothetical protein
MLAHLDSPYMALRCLPACPPVALLHRGGSSMAQHSPIEIGFQVYAVEGGEEFGAVRG